MRKKIVTNTSDQFAHQHKTANQIASSEPFFVGFSPYNTLVVGAQPAVSRFLFRQAVFCAATVRSIISLYKLVAAVNSRIFIATLSFAAKAFSILNKGPNHLKSKCEISSNLCFYFLKVVNLLQAHRSLAEKPPSLRQRWRNVVETRYREGRIFSSSSFTWFLCQESVCPG